MKNLIKQLLREYSNQNNDLINKIKESLIGELYNGDLDLSWEKFVDKQKFGDDIKIVSNIIHNFNNVKMVSGEILDDNHRLIKYHWVKINSKIYDFSKGTLKDYIDWGNIYDVDISGYEGRYREIIKKDKIHPTNDNVDINNDEDKDSHPNIPSNISDIKNMINFINSKFNVDQFIDLGVYVSVIILVDSEIV